MLIHIKKRGAPSYEDVTHTLQRPFPMGFMQHVKHPPSLCMTTSCWRPSCGLAINHVAFSQLDNVGGTLGKLMKERLRHPLFLKKKNLLIQSL